jgi:hypothetical protein
MVAVATIETISTIITCSVDFLRSDQPIQLMQQFRRDQKQDRVDFPQETILHTVDSFDRILHVIYKVSSTVGL